MSTTSPSIVSLVASKSLVETLKTAAKVAPKRSTCRDLEAVRVSFSGNDITVEATDLETWYRQTVFVPDLNVTVPFTLVASREAIIGLKAGVELSFSQETYTVAGIKYTPALFPEQFPQFPDIDKNKLDVTLGMSYFADLAACSTSASPSEVRPILTTVCHRGTAIFATDGLRLGLAEQDHEWAREFNIPAKYGPLLHKTFGKSGSYLTYDERYACYRGNARAVAVRLMDGHYPDISRIMPTQAKTAINISEIQPWLAACDAALVVHKQAGKDIRDGNFTATLTVEPSGVRFHVRRDQEFTTQLAVSAFSGETNTRNPLSIACNVQYLKDALQQVGDGATVEFNGNNQPFLLTSARDKLYRRKALVSPVRMR